MPEPLQSLLARDRCDTLDALAARPDVATHRFATCYLLCAEDAKGEHALVLDGSSARTPRKSEADRKTFVCPDYIKDAIHWACVLDTPEPPHA